MERKSEGCGNRGSTKANYQRKISVKAVTLRLIGRIFFDSLEWGNFPKCRGILVSNGI